MQKEKIAIIGAGPAGIAAAIQLKRSGIDPVVFEKKQVGGLVSEANLIENYPGFPGGIEGSKFSKLIKEQFGSLHVNAINEEVVSLNCKGNDFEIKTRNKHYAFRTVIVASGSKPKRLEKFHPSVDQNLSYELNGIRGLSGKKIGIIGAGDIAFDYAINLSSKNNVTILSRGEKVKCIPLLLERALKISRIKILYGAKILSMNHKKDRFLIGFSPDCNHGNLSFDKILVAIGREPNMDYFSAGLADNIKKNIKIKNLFLIGDVLSYTFRQVAISAGDGIKVAMQLHRENSID